jgi:hypothetical protein
MNTFKTSADRKIHLISIVEWTLEDAQMIRESREKVVYGDECNEIDDPIFAPDSDEFEFWYGDYELEYKVIETREEKWIYFVSVGNATDFIVKIGKCKPNKDNLHLRIQEARRWCKDVRLLAVMRGTDKTETILHQLFGLYFNRIGEKFEGDYHMWSLICQIPDITVFYDIDFFYYVNQKEKI